MEIEVWKDVSGYEGLYQISNFGNVKSLKRVSFHPIYIFKHLKERILKPSISSNNYLSVNLSKDGKEKLFNVHILVAIAFLNHIPQKQILVINHKNLIKTDNRLFNLEIVTMRINSDKKHLNPSSIYTGVHWHKKAKKWQSDIFVDGKLKYIGIFTTEQDAHLAYQNELFKILHK